MIEYWLGRRIQKLSNVVLNTDKSFMIENENYKNALANLSYLGELVERREDFLSTLEAIEREQVYNSLAMAIGTVEAAYTDDKEKFYNTTQYNDFKSEVLSKADSCIELSVASFLMTMDLEYIKDINDKLKCIQLFPSTLRVEYMTLVRELLFVKWNLTECFEKDIILKTDSLSSVMFWYRIDKQYQNNKQNKIFKEVEKCISNALNWDKTTILTYKEAAFIGVKLDNRTYCTQAIADKKMIAFTNYFFSIKEIESELIKPISNKIKSYGDFNRRIDGIDSIENYIAKNHQIENDELYFALYEWMLKRDYDTVVFDILQYKDRFVRLQINTYVTIRMACDNIIANESSLKEIVQFYGDGFKTDLFQNSYTHNKLYTLLYNANIISTEDVVNEIKNGNTIVKNIIFPYYISEWSELSVKIWKMKDLEMLLKDRQSYLKSAIFKTYSVSFDELKHFNKEDQRCLVESAIKIIATNNNYSTTMNHLLGLICNDHIKDIYPESELEEVVKVLVNYNDIDNSTRDELLTLFYTKEEKEKYYNDLSEQKKIKRQAEEAEKLNKTIEKLISASKTGSKEFSNELSNYTYERKVMWGLIPYLTEIVSRLNFDALFDLLQSYCRRFSYGGGTNKNEFFTAVNIILNQMNVINEEVKTNE